MKANIKDQSCRSCAIFPICFTIGLKEDELTAVEEIIPARTTFSKKDKLFAPGDHFNGIYVVRSGCFKLYNETRAGEQRIIGFYLPGELLGFDAADMKRHQHHCVALETSSVCRVSLDKLFTLASKLPLLQQQLFQLMSREIAQSSSLNLNTSARQRLAQFIISISVRAERRGLSGHQLRLSMKREDIAIYLGLASETIGRLFNQFESEELVTVKGKHITINNIAKLQSIEAGEY